MRATKLKIPATTSNFGSGFDAAGAALSLYNRVSLREMDSGGLSIRVTGEGAGHVAEDDRNIVYQAICRVFQKVEYRPAGLELDLENAIPVARGLGSSAAARVGGLTAANILSGSRLSQEEIIALAVELEGHPDNVVPAIVGGCVISTKHRDRIEYIRLEPPQPLKAVLVVPDFEVPTEMARKALPSVLSFEDAIYGVGHASLLTAALATGKLEHLRSAMEDRMHQPYRAPLVPGMNELIQAALNAGALGAAMSGAGPSMLALTREQPDHIGSRMQEVWRSMDIASRVLILDMVSEGVTVEQANL